MTEFKIRITFMMRERSPHPTDLGKSFMHRDPNDMELSPKWKRIRVAPFQTRVLVVPGLEKFLRLLAMIDAWAARMVKKGDARYAETPNDCGRRGSHSGGTAGPDSTSPRAGG